MSQLNENISGVPSSHNPFLDPIDADLSTDNLSERLSFSPLTNVDVQNLTLQARFDYLDRLQTEMFEPTSTSLNIATRLYRLIRRSLQSRDPTQPNVRRKTMSIAKFAGIELTQMPWFATYAMGMTVSGITGCDKSYEVERALKLIPQCIKHSLSADAGWTHLVQATWLYIGMSFDGSLGGLLLQILCALDEAIGTDYSDDKSLTRLSNEKLAVRVGLILRIHGVGVLVIDEIQARNFTDDTRGKHAATFFLRMLNFGIPILLIGNPYGMNTINAFSQDMRRLGAGGSIVMHPHEVTDFDWTNCLPDAIWRYNVMPQPSSIDDKDGTILHKYSGGIRDYACRICASAQRVALDADPNAQFITEAHLEAAFNGPDFSKLDRDLIRGFHEKNPIFLESFTDVPWEEYGFKWGIYSNASSSSSDTQATSASSDPQDKNTSNTGTVSQEKRPKPEQQQTKENVKRNRTRRTNEAARQEKIKQSVDAGDMRSTGLQKHLIAGFDALQSGKDTKSKS